MDNRITKINEHLEVIDLNNELTRALESIEIFSINELESLIEKSQELLKSRYTQNFGEKVIPLF